MSSLPHKSPAVRSVQARPDRPANLFDNGSLICKQLKCAKRAQPGTPEECNCDEYVKAVYITHEIQLKKRPQFVMNLEKR
jgi:hypothetical protein